MNTLRVIDSDQINEESIYKYIPRADTQFELIRDSVIKIIQEVN